VHGKQALEWPQLIREHQVAQFFKKLPINYPDIYSEWSPNEMVAVQVASGAAFTGVRGLAAMKHVGMNVASDALMTLAYTGTKGGLMIVVADDPNVHSSQNEQDSRNWARFAKIPMLEPGDAQECLDFTKIAYDISEKFDTPIILRTETRVAHSDSLVKIGKRVETKMSLSMLWYQGMSEIILFFASTCLK
jgi:indolepyruvate ferredoxin oxidoreductase alpha subunit